MNKSSSEIENERTEVEKQVLVAEKNRDTIEEKIILLRQEIAKLRIEINTYEIARIKAKEIVSQLKAQSESLKRAFWNCRNQGL